MAPGVNTHAHARGLRCDLTPVRCGMVATAAAGDVPMSGQLPAIGEVGAMRLRDSAPTGAIGRRSGVASFN